MTWVPPMSERPGAAAEGTRSARSLIGPARQAQVAIAITRAAAAWREEGYQAEIEGAFSLAAAYRDDANDLDAVAALVCEGDLAAAGRAARALDTIVRDQIPAEAWELIEGIEFPERADG